MMTGNVADLHALLPVVFRLPNQRNLTIEFVVDAATMLWNGEERQVPVLALGRRPLLGTALLESSELLIQFVEGGLVTVDGL